ncbi:MAG: CotH kinase family protein [Dysgonamonadaceae bacterium]|jgi:hypothetical protein|nr:CotH kinase family protein [Dysgonamonadaceae bacterium]
MKTEHYLRLAVIILSLFAGHELAAQAQLSNIPTFYITTDDGQNPTNKTDYKPGRIIVKSSVADENLDMVTGIRGRGNSTWGLDKKPYRIKLDKKTQLLNLPAKAKSWVLLANHGDKSLIRNAVAFKISEILELGFSPSVRFVDLVLNGEYVGNYMVTDQVEVEKKRVPVEEQDTFTTTLPDLSGGYLLEVDGFAIYEISYFYTPLKRMPITIKYPKDDEINSAQTQYIIDFTTRFESALFANNFTDPTLGYRALVDENSLINWYIACELTGNPDSFWSIYMYKYRNIDKFYFGPLWDFDIAFNNDDRLGNAVHKLMREHAHEPKVWIQRLWQDDWFKKAVNDRWKELLEDKNLKAVLTDYIDSLAADLDASQQLNYKRWDVLNKKIFREPFLFSTYQGGVDFLREYISNRIDFLSEGFASTLPQEPSVPFVADDQFYYTIQNLRSGNRMQVVNAATAVNANLELWSPLEAEPNQQWKFIALGGDKYRIINRHSQLAVSGNGYSKPLIQVTPQATDTKQQWHIVPVLSGNRYGIVNVSSAYSVNNNGGNLTDGTSAIEYTERITESENQQWFIQKEDAIATTLQPAHSQTNISVWQNLSGKVLSIQLPDNDPSEQISIEIVSLMGQSLYRTNRIVTDHTATVAIDEIGAASGVYLLKVGTNRNVSPYIGKTILKTNRL